MLAALAAVTACGSASRQTPGTVRQAPATLRAPGFDHYAGLAFATFRDEIYDPYRARRPTGPAAGAAARRVARELRAAAADAARTPQLKHLAVPLTLLAGRMGDLALPLSSGRATPADLDAANASVTEIATAARAAGLPVAHIRGDARRIARAPRTTASPAETHICLPAALRVHVSLNASGYARGERVPISVSARDASPAACQLPTGSCLPQILIIDHNGTVTWNRAETQVVCRVAMVRLGPGRAARRTVAWDGQQCAGRTPQTCTGKAVVAGTYRAVATWGTVKPASAWITIR